MKKVGFIIFIVALVAGVILANLSGFGRLGSSPFNVSFNFGKVSGSGNVITETRDVRDFSSIDVSGIFKVEATAQKDFRVEVQTDDNLLPFITTEVRDGVLHIEAEKRLKRPDNYSCLRS
jgi:putative autotransporter adhesin-like protein